MEVEVVPEDPKPKRSRKKVTLEPSYLETETLPVQEVDYGEQDVRTPVDSNGWVAHLVEPTVGDDGPPPELPDEPEYHGHGKGDKPSTALRLTMAGLYLSFGGLLLYAGAVVLHDLWKERDK